VRTVDDIKGLRIRSASVTVKSFIAALGGIPVGVPPAASPMHCRKITDGCFVDYGGAHTAFRPGGRQIHYRNVFIRESFGVVMNPTRPPIYHRSAKVVEETTRLHRTGKLWDLADAPGKQYLMPKAIRRSCCQRSRIMLPGQIRNDDPRKCWLSLM
jgi:hypothetical protein